MFLVHNQCSASSSTRFAINKRTLHHQHTQLHSHNHPIWRTHTTNYERRTHHHSESVARHASGYIIVIIINVCLSYHHRRSPSTSSSSVSASAVGTMAHRTQQIHYSYILFAKFEELTNGKNLFAEFINANEMHARNLLRSARCVYILVWTVSLIQYRALWINVFYFSLSVLRSPLLSNTFGSFSSEKFKPT